MGPKSHTETPLSPIFQKQHFMVNYNTKLISKCQHPDYKGSKHSPFAGFFIVCCCTRNRISCRDLCTGFFGLSLAQVGEGATIGICPAHCMLHGLFALIRHRLCGKEACFPTTWFLVQFHCMAL
uniref:Uncharacterized protein n=1 Tax=Octopus bimaculoides TaxID=37653 RepID=A0A0L8FPE7_OCTBM